MAKEVYLKCAQNNMSRDNHWKSVKASIAQIYSQIPTIFYYNYIEAVVSYRYTLHIHNHAMCMHLKSFWTKMHAYVYMHTGDGIVHAE